MRYILFALLLFAAAPAYAQVGHLPEQSPFRDIRPNMGLTGFIGIFNGNQGTAGVGLQRGTAVGARYDWRLTGPLSLTTRVSGVIADRTVRDPGLPAEQQEVGTESSTLTIADIGFSFGLTGARTWRRVAPVLNVGVGLSTDLGATPDPGGFALGTALALTMGGGVRYVSEGRTSFRLDFTNYMLRYQYPQTFFTPPAGGAPILQPGDPAREWRHNPAVTIGVTYMFGR